MILGVHASIRAGYEAALHAAARLGCRAVQIFSYQRHHDPAPEEVALFRNAAAQRGVRVLAHTRYVPFLGSRDNARHQRSAALLRRELLLAAGLGAEGLVLHAGAYAAGDEKAKGIFRVAEGILHALEQGRAPVRLLFENVPGGGRRLGGALEELAELAAILDHRGVNLGFCLDTAHAWAQGYDLSTAEGMRRFFGRAHRLLGAERIRAFHLNDSRALLGSHREHHWHWGKGYIGVEGLKFLLGRPEFADALGILETPAGADHDNLAALRALSK